MVTNAEPLQKTDWFGLARYLQLPQPGVLQPRARANGAANEVEVSLTSKLEYAAAGCASGSVVAVCPPSATKSAAGADGKRLLLPG